MNKWIGERAKVRTKKVLLCGGTNFLGPHLIRRLVEKGYDITVCTRGIHKIPSGGSIKNIICDCNNDEEGVKKALGGMEFDIVIDCIAYCPEEVFHVLSNVKTERYIQVSSIGVYWDVPDSQGDRCNSLICEDYFDPRKYENWKPKSDSTTQYGDRKKYAECVAYQMFSQYNPVSVRPAYVADPSNPLHEQNVRLPEIVDWVRCGKGFRNANHLNKICFTRVDEEADLILKLCENSYSSPLNIASSGYVEVQDIISYIAEKMGKSVHYDVNGKLPNFSQSIRLDIERLTEVGYVPSQLNDWFWKYLDYYLEFPIEKYRPWETVKGEIDTFRR